MTRLGVLVVMLALTGSAVADKTPAKKPAPTKADAQKSKAADSKKEAPPADDTAGDDGTAADPNDPNAPPADDADAQIPPHVTGPKTVDLGNQVSIDVPDGIILLEKVEAQKLVEKSGTSGEGVVAVILNPASTWWMSVDYDGAGYVDDDDADKLDADELLKSFQDGTREQNVRRTQLGLPDLYLDGWTEMPRYDRPMHHLVWGLKGHSTNGVSINFFTRILGRNGFLSVDLIDSPENIEKSKVEAQKILAAIHFTSGARYEDHKSDDKSSGMGLRALVLGGAGVAVAAKSGLILKLLLIFKKAIIFVVAAIAGFFRWLFGKKKKDDFTIPPSDPPPADPNAPPNV